MELAWRNDSPHARFLRSLKRRRVDALLNSPGRLQDLRHDWEGLMRVTKLFSPVFQERGIDFPEFVIHNTRAQRAPPEDEREVLCLPVFDFAPLPATEHTIWSAWCPIQACVAKHGLFLPTDVFHLIGSYMAQPECPEPYYDTDLEDEWTLPGLQIKLV